MRRRHPLGPVLALLALLAASVAVGGAAAQGATPGPAGLNYPALKITVTDAGYEVATPQVAAGRYLVTLDNTGKQGVAAHLMLPAGGHTLADVEAAVAAANATPAPGASPAAGAGAPPAWFYQSKFAGGPAAPAGTQVQAVVDLTAGTWLVFSPDPSVHLKPATLTVTGGTPTAAGPEPAADVTVQLQEYAFVGLDKGVPAGKHVWKVSNVGKQPHIIVLTTAPKGITMDQVMTLVSLPGNATPPPGFPYKESDFDFNQPGLGLLGPGETAWPVFDLKAGTYVALCFVPDEKTGAPHAAMGMIAIFDVA